NYPDVDLVDPKWSFSGVPWHGRPETTGAPGLILGGRARRPGLKAIPLVALGKVSSCSRAPPHKPDQLVAAFEADGVAELLGGVLESARPPRCPCRRRRTGPG